MTGRKTSLSTLALILLVSVGFFVLLTQRVLVSSEGPSHVEPPKKKTNDSRPLGTETLVTPVPVKTTGGRNIIFTPVDHGTVPTQSPTYKPTIASTIASTSLPTAVPTVVPTFQPTALPTAVPTLQPTTLVNVVTAVNVTSRRPLFIDTHTAVSNKSLPVVVDHSHPYASPRPGTDISDPDAHPEILQCPNQAKCIIPELQLERRYKIYLCKHTASVGGLRFYFLAREGLVLHPNVDLVHQSQIHEADYLVLMPGSSPFSNSECNSTEYTNKLIVLDEYDGVNVIMPVNASTYRQMFGSIGNTWYYTYFKRSFARKEDGVFEGYPILAHKDAFPLTYAVAENYLSHEFHTTQRETELWCTLRGSKHMTTRLRVQEWVAEYVKVRAVKNATTSQVNTQDRGNFSNNHYFESMYHSQFIVTVNPTNWEGDFRLWEALSSGALVFVDPVFVPHPFPLISGEHVIYFSNTNKTELFAKLDYYRRNKEEARRIAINGYLHAMKYHRTVNLIDYVLRTTHMKEAMEAKAKKLPQYSFTGQYLNQEAKFQLEQIRLCQYPGIYDDPVLKMHSNMSALGLVAAEQHTKRLYCPKKSLTPGMNIQFLNR